MSNKKPISTDKLKLVPVNSDREAHSPDSAVASDQKKPVERKK